MRLATSLISLLVAVTLVIALTPAQPAAGLTDDNTEGDNIMNERASADELPLWAQQKPLWELAQEGTRQYPIPRDDPAPVGQYRGGQGVPINNPEVKISLWGPPEQLTWSFGKTDVWDRRLFPEKPITLEQIRERCFSPDYPEHPFWNLASHYDSYSAYDFPCAKPVGQLILMCPDLAGAEPPVATMRLRDGLVTVPLKSAAASATVESLLMMTRNLLLVRGQFEGLTQPLGVRLYRHRDTIRPGMSYFRGGPQPQPKWDYDYSKDSPANGPLEPPTAGSEGRFFWIRQDFPGEPTFPDGFWYVFMGLVVGEDYEVEVIEGEKGLGTPPYFSITVHGGKEGQSRESLFFYQFMPWYEPIRNASGAAATATIASQSLTILGTVVTSAEVSDPMAAAREELLRAQQKGYEALLAENEAWWRRYYQSRETGRVYYRRSQQNAAVMQEVFRAWGYNYAGRTQPQASEWEADAIFAYLEQDWSPWHGDVHLNETHTEPQCVQNRLDQLEIWYDLAEFLLPRARRNAQEVYGCRGAMVGLTHVPVRTETIYHSNVIWEQGMDLTAMLVKVLWNRYDYGGDEEYLREHAYPWLKAGAEFYTDYVTPGEDGYFHVIPTVSQENWGLTYQFERNKDSISALCAIKWQLNTAAEAAQILGVDLDQVAQWRHIAANMAPYPTYQTEEGTIFVDVRDAPPIDYSLYAPCYPAVLTEDINLDSPPKELEIMKRTVTRGRSRPNSIARTVILCEPGLGPENLLNSRSGRIRLFPAVSEGVDVGFRKFLAKGAFEVSAEYVDGVVSPIFIYSRLGNRCKLVNPWPGRQVLIRELGVDEPLRIRGSRLQFRTRREATYKIEPATP